VVELKRVGVSVSFPVGIAWACPEHRRGIRILRVRSKRVGLEAVVVFFR
jgi:hypothetical protein